MDDDSDEDGDERESAGAAVQLAAPSPPADVVAQGPPLGEEAFDGWEAFFESVTVYQARSFQVCHKTAQLSVYL